MERALHLYHLRCAEVYQLGVSFHVYYEVLWLQVSVYDPQRREVLQQQDHAPDVELTVLCAQQPYLSYHIIQLLAPNELHQRVKELIVLECLVQLNHEREVHSLQQVFLLDEVALYEVLLYLLLAVGL